MSALSELHETFVRRHERARQWKAAGRKLCGYLYSYVPEELVYAAGMVPIQLTDGDDREVYMQGKEQLEDFYCDFSCSCVGQGISGVYDYLDGVIFSDCCETMRTVAALWKLHVHSTKFLHFFTTCNDDNAESRAFFRDELLDLKATLEKRVGHTITDEDIHNAICVYNENRALLRQVYSLRQGARPRLSARETFDAVAAGLVMPKEEHTVLLRRLLQENTADRPAGSGPRLLFSSVIFEDTIAENSDVVGLIEELGGQIVMDDLCSGVRCMWDATAENGNWIEALTDRYMARVPGAFKYDGFRRGEELLALGQRHDVDGAIFVIPRYCTPYLWEYPHLARRLEEGGIPNLMLESTQSTALLAVRTRVEAFLEMLGTS